MISEAPGGFTNRRVFFYISTAQRAVLHHPPTGGFFTMSPRLIFHHGAAVLHREAKPNLKYTAPTLNTNFPRIGSSISDSREFELKIKHRASLKTRQIGAWLAFTIYNLQSTIYNLQSEKLGGLSPADMRGLYHRSRPRLRVSLRSLASGFSAIRRDGAPWQAALSGAGGSKCDSGFAYHRRKPAFSYIVDCKWLVSA